MPTSATAGDFPELDHRVCVIAASVTCLSQGETAKDTLGKVQQHHMPRSAQTGKRAVQLKCDQYTPKCTKDIVVQDIDELEDTNTNGLLHA